MNRVWLIYGSLAVSGLTFVAMPAWLLGMIERRFGEGDPRTTVWILLVGLYAGFGIALSLAYWSVDSRKASEASVAKLTSFASKISIAYMISFVALAFYAVLSF